MVGLTTREEYNQELENVRIATIRARVSSKNRNKHKCLKCNLYNCCCQISLKDWLKK